MYFISPTKGIMSFEKMFDDIIKFIKEAPDESYKLIIGTDSHTRDDVCFVTAVVVHRLGKGARYYYSKRKDRKITSLRQRIFYETSLSLSVASRVYERMARDQRANLDIEIHIDVGQHGETRNLVKEIVGMVVGSGFDAKIKPDSFGASKVADKHSK